MQARIILSVLSVLAMSSAVAADHKTEIYQQLGIALATGQCSAVLQKYATYGGTTASSYIADNDKLHQCQYIQETVAAGACSTSRKCPTYAEWSKANLDFSPSLPRDVFVAKLETRQARVAGLRAAAASMN